MTRERDGLLFCRHSVWAAFRSSMFLCRLCMHWILWWGWSLHLEKRISGAVCHMQKADGLLSDLAMISERGVVYRTTRMGPSTEPWGYMSCDGDEDELFDWSGLISVCEVWLKPLESSRLNAENRVQTGEENVVVSSIKSGRKIQQKKNRNVVTVQSGENKIIVYNT